MSDLTLHFLAGLAISGLFLLIFGRRKYDDYYNMMRRTDWAVVVAVGLSLALGLAKEYYDYKTGGNVEMADITLTWSGGIIALVVIVVADLIVDYIKDRFNN